VRNLHRRELPRLDVGWEDPLEEHTPARVSDILYIRVNGTLPMTDVTLRPRSMRRIRVVDRVDGCGLAPVPIYGTLSPEPQKRLDLIRDTRLRRFSDEPNNVLKDVPPLVGPSHWRTTGTVSG
jgi:hypothetical protein